VINESEQTPKLIAKHDKPSKQHILNLLKYQQKIIQEFYSKLFYQA
jgi:ribosomal protein S30